jgi:hypothetical protein
MWILRRKNKLEKAIILLREHDFCWKSKLSNRYFCHFLCKLFQSGSSLLKIIRYVLCGPSMMDCPETSIRIDGPHGMCANVLSLWTYAPLRNSHQIGYFLDFAYLYFWKKKLCSVSIWPHQPPNLLYMYT